MEGDREEEDEYGFVPAHLRHRFAVGIFGGDAQEREEIRSARRTRSAHLVSSALEPRASPGTPQHTGTKLYSQAIEHVITSRMTFDRTLGRLEEHFREHSATLRQLEAAQPVVVPEWLYSAKARLPTLLQVQRHILQAAESCLSDADVYLAMFEPLPSPPAASPTPLLRFTVCSSKSSMAHKVLMKAPEDGRDRDTPQSSSSSSNQKPSQDSEIQHSGEQRQKQRYSASFEAMESMQELVLEDIDGYSSEQIHRFSADTVTGPFACFPLINGSKTTAIGVLSLDSCRKALRLRPESMTSAELSEFLVRKGIKDAATELKKHRLNGRQFLSITERDLNHKPMFASLKINTRKRILELVHALKRGAMVHLARPVRYFLDDPDALKFLHNLSLSAGAFLEGFRGVHWHFAMANVTRDPQCTVYDVYDVLLRGIAQSVDFVERVVVWRVTQKPHAQVDVVASTQVPDDRLMPFLQWSERLIKRVVLYKVSTEPHNGSNYSLLQGSIMRIILPNQEPEREDGAPVLCERAQYQVSWSNRSVERCSWAQLRQLLPVRAMNVKHFQLAHLLERLEHEQLSTSSHNHARTSIASGVVQLKTPNGLALDLHDLQCSANEVQYVLQVDFSTSSYEAPRSVVASLRRAAGISERSLACVRGREIRRVNRQLSSQRVSQSFHSMGLTPSPDALRALSEVVARVFKEIADNLPGVELQVAELQPDGSQLKYTFTANGSTLLDKSPTANRDDDEFPFVFLALFHEDCAVGVLSVNRFVDVVKGRADEEQPESGVLQYLQTLVKPLGSAIYLKRRSFALYNLQILAHEPLRSPHQLMLNACRAVKDVVVGAWKVRLVEVNCVQGKTSAIYELSESERVVEASPDFLFAAPIRLRMREMLADTLEKHFNLPAAEIEAIYARIKACDQEDEEDARRLQQIEADGARLTAISSVPESEKRRLQVKRVTGKYFQLLLTQQPSEGVRTELELDKQHDRFSNEKYVSHALSVFLGTKTNHSCAVPALTLQKNARVFLTSANLPQFHAVCEQNYIARVGETLSKLMEALYERVERSRTRVRVLEAFELTCEQAMGDIRAKLSLVEPEARSKDVKAAHAKHGLSPEEELAIEAGLALQQRAIALLESVFAKTNVYIGLLEPSLKLIRYTSASGSSVMKGKHLKHGHGVSFAAVETQAPIVVAQSNVQTAADEHDEEGGGSLAKKLRYFAKEPKKQKWPFIVVPVGSFGVLCLDDLERYERLTCEPQPEIGVIDFLRQVAAQLARVVAFARQSSKAARQARRTQALTRVMRACDDVTKARAPLYLQTVVVQEIESALNGVDAYIGIVQPLCDSIRFTCASARSYMAGQALNTVDSASFRVFTTQRPLVIPQLQSYWRYQQEQESAAIASNGKLKAFGSHRNLAGPYVCVPIPFIGVLSVDSFPGAAGGVYTKHFPEKGVVEFLSRVANHLGENMRTHSALATSRNIPEVFQGNKSTLQTVFREILHEITGNLVAVDEVQVVRFTSLDASGYEERSPPLAAMRRVRADPSAVSIDALKPDIVRQIQQRQASDDGLESACFILPHAPEVVVVVLESTRDVESDSAALLSTAIILRRVRGAAWSYDLEFLRSILPLMNDLITQVNARIEGVVARRCALAQIDRISREQVDELQPREAMEKLHNAAAAVLELVSQGLSLSGCDVYMGERAIGGDSLTFSCASRESLMESVTLSLSDPSNQSLVTVQCLEHKQQSIVHLVDARSDKSLRSLTAKKCSRVHIVVPMGDDRILCADSLGAEAFHPKTRKLEAGVLQFLHASAAKLNELILTTQYRLSYDELVRLKSKRHANFRLFFSTLLQIVRRDLVVLHSQQIVTLASDFTGRYHVEAWHSSRTRRPLATELEHFCYLSQCEEHLIALGIHNETRVQLPMTNLPRTLDESRSSLEPVEGIEKRGVFACSCLATMLDAQMAAPRVALIVYTRDAKAASSSSGSKASVVAFTANQRRFFFALAAVAADVFTHVYRSCALSSFAQEVFFYLRELMSAKEGFVVQVQSKNAETGVDANGTDSGTGTLAVVLLSSQEAKRSRNSVLKDALAAKVLQFHASQAEFAIFVRKKPEVVDTAAPRKTAAVPKPSAPPQAPPVAAKTAPHSFFKRPEIFRSRKAKAKQQEQEHAVEQLQHQQQEQQIGSRGPYTDSQFKFHVLLRGVELFGRAEVFSFDVEHRSMDGAQVFERIARQTRASAQSLADTFVRKPPRGDEDMIGSILGEEAGNSAHHVSSGGGFFLFTQLKEAKQNLQRVLLGLETDIRGYLTGVQPTARAPMLPGVSPAEHLHLAAPVAPSAPQKSIFAEDNESPESVSVSQAAMVLLEASMLLVGGIKREALAKMDRQALLKEYLRGKIGKKLVEVNARDRRQWGLVLRLRTFLQSQDKAVILQSHMAWLIVAADSVQDHDHERTSLRASNASAALQAMWRLHTTLISVVRYQKQLEGDVAREKLQLDTTATILQCCYRVARSKMQLKQLRKEFVAARTIQCAFRQHLARRRTLFMKWNRAAIKVQRAYRLKLLRRKGLRPKRLSDELLTISKRHGGLAAPASKRLEDEDDGDGGSGNGEWRVEMDAFDSFKAYLASRAGKEQLKREERVMTQRMHEIAKEREKLPAEQRMMEDVKDLFELMDTEGTGELRRDDTREMMARLRIPLARDEADDVIDMMDNDRSGEISLTEFTNWFFHEYPLLKKRSRDCGVVSRKDWQWVIENSARSALRKRWRAQRIGQRGGDRACPQEAEVAEQQGEQEDGLGAEPESRNGASDTTE